MTNEEIVEGNLLLADFMGVKIGEDEYSWRPGARDRLQESHLAYHSAWGWLMPVVEKIESLDYWTLLQRKSCWIYRMSHDEISGDCSFIQADQPTKLLNTYMAVVKFCKWYKEQGK